jgi:hypothetical protein
MNRLARAAGLTALLVLGGCGPTAREMGQAVMWAAPMITILVLGLAWGYARLWRPLLDEPLRVDRRPAVLVAALQILVGCATLLRPELDGDLILIAVWAVGTSHLTLVLLPLRLALRSGTTAYSWVIVAPWLLLYPPAVLLGLVLRDPGTDVSDAAAMLWILPGWAGWVTGPLALIAVAEVVIRRVRRARRLAAQKPPPPPVATARFRD